MDTLYFKLFIKLLKRFVSLVFTVLFVEKKNNVLAFFAKLGAKKTAQPKYNTLTFAKTTSVFKSNNAFASLFHFPSNLSISSLKNWVLPFVLFFAFTFSQNGFGQIAVTSSVLDFILFTNRNTNNTKENNE